MQQGLLPLFPLEVVMLPGGQLPLHIFEERYKEMIGEARQAESEFGIVFASEKGIANTGCSATIAQVLKEYDDGRLDILTLGRRRFEILLVNEEREFLQGAVEFFDDDSDKEDAGGNVLTDDGKDAEQTDLRQRAVACYHSLRGMPMGDAGQPQPGGVPRHMSESEIDLNDPRLSFRLAQPIQDLGFRQTLLTTRSETERLRQIIEFLPAFTRQQQRAEHIRKVAPRNGHGGGHVGG